MGVLHPRSGPDSSSPVISGWSVTELVSMIECQRSYEMNSKAISTTDQMLQYLTQNLS